MFVKVNAINNLSDARYCAGMGALMLGFILDKTHNAYVDPEKFKAITAWLNGIQFIGELPTSIDRKYAIKVASQYKIDMLQVDLNIVSDFFLASMSYPIILCIQLHEKQTFSSLQAICQKYYKKVAYFLIQYSICSDHYMHIAQEYVTKLALSFPIIQGFNIKKDNIKHIKSMTKIQGIALEGGYELRPGYKDFDNLSNILEEVFEY